MYHWLHTCYETVEGFKEKDSVNGRSSRPNVFSKVFIKKESLLNKDIGLQFATLQKIDSSTGV